MSSSELADRTLRVAIRVHGEAYTYTPEGGAELTLGVNGAALRGVFDRAGALIPLETGMLQRTGIPQLGIRLADLPEPAKKGAKVVVRSTAYRIDDIDPDGQGYAVLILGVA